MPMSELEIKLLPVLDLFKNPEPSAPPLGRDDERNGDTVGFCGGCRMFMAALTDSVELVATVCEGLSLRRWMELLLLRLATSDLSARCLEKKELFEAVMGVVGVLEFCLTGGGLSTFRF